MELRVGDVVHLRKKHPCGSYRWQIERLGADIGIRCQGCDRKVFLERRVFERKVKTLVSRGSSDQDTVPSKQSY